MLGEIKLMQSDIHELNNPSFINHEGCGASNVIRVDSQPMVDTIVLDHFPILVS